MATGGQFLSLTCPLCGLSRSVPTSRIPQAPVMVTCPKCKGRFLFQGVDGPLETHEKLDALTVAGTVAVPPVSASSSQIQSAVQVGGNKPTGSLAAKEYRMTYVVRILTAITALPIGLLLTSCLFKSNGPDFLVGFMGVAMVVATVLVWVYHGSRKIIFHKTRLEVRSIFGSAALVLNEKVAIYSDTQNCNTAAAGMLFGAVGGLAIGIAERFMSEESKTHVNLTVSDGTKRIKLNSNIKGIGEIKERLVEIESNMIMPALEAHYLKGRKIAFGPITLHNGMLTARNESVRIRDIEGFELERGTLIVNKRYQTSPFLKTKATGVPNIGTLCALTERFSLSA